MQNHSMGGGLLVRLSHKNAARFAFPLATPIIGAAALLKLRSSPAPRGTASADRPPGLLRRDRVPGRRFLMRYFETRTLVPFAVYCLAAGMATAISFAAS